MCSYLIQPHEKHRSFGRMGCRGKLLGAIMVVAEDTDANPPIAGRTGEAQHFGGAIAPSEVTGEIRGGAFMRESADLHGPFSTRVKRNRRLHHFDANLRDTRLIDIDLTGGCKREVDNASGNERAAIGNAHESGMICLEIGYAHNRSERQRTVRGGHGVHVIDFAVRPASRVIGRPIPTRKSCF